MEQRVTIIPAYKNNTVEQQPPKRLRVAAYCRVSTDHDEQQGSLEAQVQYFTSKIESNPLWISSGIFVDEGISATGSKKRPEFNKMMRACARGKIDMILVKSISRFFRNTLLCNDSINTLLKHNVSVIFEKEGINTGEIGGRLLRDVLTILAQSESENIGRNVKWGKRKQWENNKAGYHSCPYGYRRIHGELTIHEEQAETVKEIYHLYLDGYSLRSIAAQLSCERILTSTGQSTWSPFVISAILKNEVYVGDVIRQKSYSVDSISQKIKKNNGELPKYYFEDHHAPIIDRETFSLVQEEYFRRKKKRTKPLEKRVKKGRYNSKYQLSNLLVCGECGCRYYRCHWRNKQIVWRCSNRLQRVENCANSPSVPEHQLCRMLLTAITKYGAANEVRDLLHAIYCGKIESVDLLNLRIEQDLTMLEQDIDMIQQDINISGSGTMEAFNHFLRMLIQSIQVLPKRAVFTFHDDVVIETGLA